MGTGIFSADDIVIVAAKRTPIGGFQGSLSLLSAPELAGIAIHSMIKSVSLPPDNIDEVILGCVLSAGVKQAPARQAALKADLPYSCCATTINKVCGSGMKAVMMACNQLQTNDNNIVVAGGMESMSQAPYLLNNMRTGKRMGHDGIYDHMFCDGLEDAYSGKTMGSFAQKTADEHGISRQEMDDFAIDSLNKAKNAIANHVFDAEIATVSYIHKNDKVIIDTDEQPLNAKISKIRGLKPAFSQNGTITAANSSSISDGAAALLLMKQSKAQSLNLPILAKIKGYVSHAQAPELFTTAPITAIEKLLTKLNWHKNDVDLFEINEAFAMVTLITMAKLKLDVAKVNIHGGACALGHPIGCSGARIIVTLIHALNNKGLKRGIASLCIGGGEATALAIEIN